MDCRLRRGATTFGSVKTPAELTETFRANGLKVTPQRQLIFGLMHGNTVHPTAEALFAEASERMPGISLRTVYQTLTDLASMGELRLIDVGTGATRFDPNIDDHHHVVCSSCGEVRDVYVAGSDRLKVEGLDGFTVDEASILFSGTCSACTAAVDKVSRASVRGEAKKPTNPKERLS